MLGPGPLLAVLAAGDFLEKRPSPGDGFTTSPTPYVIVLLLGFAIGIGGHIFKSKTMVITGILMIMLATVLIPIYLALTR